ncbi:MAG: hypothetical protein DLM58_15280 [Pseudonocardiales bacterium]|nr:MAG: hypothetical protein DLM58_15280 [Pseudonocardiales bacterium]
MILGVLRGMQVETNRLAVADQAFIAELDSQGTARELACGTTATLLTRLLNIHPGEAGQRVKAAGNMGPRRGLPGEALPPIFEKVAAAQAAGAISTAHARVITKAITDLHDSVPAGNEEWVQAALVEEAHDNNPAQLSHVARAMSYLINQDGTPPSEDERRRRRNLRIRRRDDGTLRLEGELTALCAEALLSALEPLAAPAPAAADGAKDPRTSGQRLHDALYDAALLALRSKQLPDCGGFAATILLTMTAEQFATGKGPVRTGHGDHVGMDEALTLFGDSRIVPVVLGRTKQILTHGGSHRIFTEGQRLAMIARDQGCSFPTCDRPPALCQAHHVTDYSITHRTSVDDGTLLCGFHHREHPRLGWTCRMINGTPHWTAPAWLDPTHTLRRNRAHDLLPV